MNEHAEHSPEGEKTKIIERTIEALKRWKESLEGAGRRTLFVLGPAMAIGAPAFGAENEAMVEVSPKSEIRCDVAYVNANGEHVGNAAIDLPDLESLPQEDATLPAEVRTNGDCTGDRLVGMLTELQNQPKPEQAPEDPSILDKIKTTAKKINDQTYTERVKGLPGNTLGWTFKIDTSTSPQWAPYDVKLTTALVVQDQDIGRMMKGKLPDSVPGAFIKITVKPRS